MLRSTLSPILALATCLLAPSAAQIAPPRTSPAPTLLPSALPPAGPCTASCPPPAPCSAGVLRTVCFEAVYPASPVSPSCAPDFAPPDWDSEYISPFGGVPALFLPRFDPGAFPGCAQLLQAELVFEGSFQGSIQAVNNAPSSTCTMNVLATAQFGFTNHALFANPITFVTAYAQNVSLAPHGGTAVIHVPNTTAIGPDPALGQPPACFTAPSVLASEFLASPGNSTLRIDHAVDGSVSHAACPQVQIDDQVCAQVRARVIYTYCEQNTAITSTCAGDGLDPAITTPCPCSNFGAFGRGCANSANAEGALLATVGCPTSNPETVVLVASGMSGSSPVVFLAGDQSFAGGALFFDGVRCVDGTILRLATNPSSAGAAAFPMPGQPLLSIRGNTPVGSGLVAHYQTSYRNASPAFCPPGTANLTNGVRIVW